MLTIEVHAVTGGQTLHSTQSLKLFSDHLQTHCLENKVLDILVLWTIRFGPNSYH